MMEQGKIRGDKSSALVVGAGIAGMQSALLLAEMGIKVFLLQEGPGIGGYFPLLDKTFPTNSCGVCFMSPTPPAFCPIYECHLHDNIELLPYSQAIPHSLVIDPKTCTRCGECVKVCSPGAIDLDMKEEEEKIEVGAILLGFGFEPFIAQRKGEYGFGRYENVLTSIQFERLLSTSSPTQGLPTRVSDGKRMEKIAFIQCVGSRDPSCGQDHCSTICCMYATKQAMIAKDRASGLNVTFFYIDIAPMGEDYERYYERAKSEYGIEYIRGAVSSIKEVKHPKELST